MFVRLQWFSISFIILQPIIENSLLIEKCALSIVIRNDLSNEQLVLILVGSLKADCRILPSILIVEAPLVVLKNPEVIRYRQRKYSDSILYGFNLETGSIYGVS